jgi:hypothetical protein
MTLEEELRENKLRFSKKFCEEMDQQIYRHLRYLTYYYQKTDDDKRDARKKLHWDDNKYAVMGYWGGRHIMAWRGRDSGKFYKDNGRVPSNMPLKNFGYERKATSFDF